MSTEAVFVRPATTYLIQLQQSQASGELYQLPDGRAAFLNSDTAGSSSDQLYEQTTGVVTLPKATSIVILAGGRCYWDASASQVTFKKVSDRDFYVGRAVAKVTTGTGDWSSNDVQIQVDLNVDPPYDLDLARDPFTTAIVGTQALGGLALLRRGGAHDIVIDSTNEAQKVDMLGQDGFAAGGANAIVEFAFTVPSDGAGTVVDVNVGVASATHATDADSIAQHLLMHLDANNTNINFQSKDGTTTVTATDSTKDYTQGQTNATRVEVWMDMRVPSSVKLYVDGVNVLSGTTYDVSAAAATWYLLCHIEKTAATDTYEFQLDWLRARFAEQ